MTTDRRPKRFLTATLILVLMVGGATVSAAGANPSTDSAVNMMLAMGVLSGDGSGDYNLSSTVTRAQFAKMLIMVSPYKDLVATSAQSSIFRDVPADNWANPYIRLAAANGLLAGYSDGTFRPADAITLEQAVNSALRLLGYTSSDFTGMFPYAQMSLSNRIGLSANVTNGIGSAITKQDAVNLLYNLLTCEMKDVDRKYAESLGYSLNGSGEVDYAQVVSSNIYGPFTVKTYDWASELGLNESELTIYRNGSEVSPSDVELYDVIYYTAFRTAVWVYDDKVTGVYEKAMPNQDTVASLTVSGTDYTIESTAAYAALSSSGSLKIGDGVTLLIGRKGGVVDAFPAAMLKEESVMYVTAVGSKTFKDGSGNAYTSNYVRGITADCRQFEYPVSRSSIGIGDVVRISFNDNGDMRVEPADSDLSGSVDANLMLIGNKTIAQDARIADTYMGDYCPISVRRIDGLRVSEDQVLYCKAEDGEIQELILKNVTGDMMEYGVVLSAATTGSEWAENGTYVYDVGGTSHTLNTQNRTLSVKPGPALMYGEGGTISTMRNLTSIGSRITGVTPNSVTAAGVTYVFSPDVVVYTKTGDNYRLATLEDALAAGKSSRYYYDKAPDDGGRIRVIVVSY